MSAVHIFGAGPTGLTLAWIYGKQGRKVTVYEKYDKVGGSWAAKWTKDGKFTHHSPQILSTAYVNTFDLFEEMGIDKDLFLIPYASSWKDMDIEILDYVVLGYAYIDFIFRGLDNVTVSEYFRGRLSDKGVKEIRGLCYLLDGVPPSVMTVGELFGAFDQTIFYSTLEMSRASDDVDGMGRLWHKELLDIGVSFQFGEELGKIDHVGSDDLIVTTSKRSLHVSSCDEVILAMDPASLVKILDRSPSVSPNWGSNWRNHLQGGIYNSLSVQFHLSKDYGGLNSATQKGMSTDWDIICVQLPHSVTPGWVTLSATILDISHVEGMNEYMVKTEAWRQIRLANPNLPELPCDITIGEGTSFDNGKWKFDMSAYAHTTMGPFPSRGPIRNLSIVGPMNKRRFRATTMEAAVEAAKLFAGYPIRHSSTLSATIIVASLFVLMIVLTLVLI